MRSLVAISRGMMSVALAACSDPAPGTLEVYVYGEEYIEDSIPSDVFVDGWSVTFNKFLVSIGNVAAQAGHQVDELNHPEFQVFDLAASSGGHGVRVATFDAPAGTYDHFGYVIAPDGGATAGNAEAEDVAALIVDGFGVRVVGVATKGEDTIQFDWGFPLSATYSHCEIEDEVDGNIVAIQATIHGDHLFYDDAVSADPNVTFDLIAASDENSDGVVTAQELAGTDLTAEERYQVGSLEIEDLWGFISHQVGTLGHVNGEGHCDDVLTSGEQ